MWVYEKKLQYPVRIKQTNTKLAKIIISQYGGADGELGASLRYLSQRYSVPYPEIKAVLTDIGTEELAHLEMIGAIVYQLTKKIKPDVLENIISGQMSCQRAFMTGDMQVKGDLVTDIHENLAAEQKARTTYDNILRFCDDPDVIDPIRFLRAREIVHYQRFGEPKRIKCNKVDNGLIYRLLLMYDYDVLFEYGSFIQISIFFLQFFYCQMQFFSPSCTFAIFAAMNIFCFHFFINDFHIFVIIVPKIIPFRLEFFKIRVIFINHVSPLSYMRNDTFLP